MKNNATVDFILETPIPGGRRAVDKIKSAQG